MSGFRHVAYGFALVLCVVLLWTGRNVREEQPSVDVSSFQKRNNALQDWPTVYSPGHQNPQIAPPLPIQKISNDYIIAQSSTNSTNSTSVFRRLRRGLHASASSTKFNPLFRREVERCSTGSPCADGSCCGSTGICGYGPAYCGSGNCTSNCDATAMCGQYSEGGAIACGMNLCCSSHGWCGTTELYCGDTLEGGACQRGYGSCQTFPAPSCGSSGSTSGRTIGYYQSWNVRQRLCNRVEPTQINTTGLSHLYFAFASIDPHSFAVVAANEADVAMYTEFTGLKTANLKTWIAIGGFDFSDANATTHTTWSDMVSSASSRSAFISSLKSFMDRYGFQGVDLDWEYPGSETRGGKRADTENFVSLVREMRSAYGSNYGISLTLAPDYWYLRYFDAIAMEPYVDWFGFMSYDLHGSWDADTKTLGSIVRGQADIREIYNDTMPLWFDGLNPSKINFGLAYYGRGCTVTSPNCAYIGCSFAGPSKPGPCTNFDGVMSLREIEALIEDKGIVPEYLAAPMMKQITWDDQWIGYDDLETIANKKSWADKMCFGGTMIWSVDFMATGSGNKPDGINLPTTTDGSCGKGIVCGNWETGSCCSSAGYCGSTSGYCGNGCQSGDCWSSFETTDGTCGAAFSDSICGSWSKGACCSSSGYCGDSDAHCGDGCQSGPCYNTTSDTGSGEDVYIDPIIWSSSSPQATCDAPCNLILPPLTLDSPTTISFPPITTSLEVAWPSVTTITQNGNTTVSTGWQLITETTIITVPPITTSIIDVWNFNWTNSGVSETSYTVTTSVVPPIIILTDNPPGTTSPGVTYPVQTRTFQPPPWPTGYNKPSSTEPDHTQPVVVVHSGKPPGPTCHTGCGSKCRLFCSHGSHCGFGCWDDPFNWPDPHGPHPHDPKPIADPGDNDDGCSTSTYSSCSTSCLAMSATTSCTTSCTDVVGCEATATDVSSIYTIAPADVVTAWEDWSDEDYTMDDSLWWSVGSMVYSVDGALPMQGPAGATTSRGTAQPASTSQSTTPKQTPTTTLATTAAGPLPTDFIDCTHHNQDPGEGVTKAYCVCSGSTFAEQLADNVTPRQSCAYTTMPSVTMQLNTGLATSTYKDTCQVCTLDNSNEQHCTSLSDCTPKTTSQAPPKPTDRCITAHVMQTNCATDWVNDLMGVEVWDNGVHVCHGTTSHTLAGLNTVWPGECNPGFIANVTGNGQVLRYQASDGYYVQLEASNMHSIISTCGTVGKAEIKGKEWEFVFDNGHCANCDVAKLCDYTFYCPHFKGECH